MIRKRENATCQQKSMIYGKIRPGSKRMLSGPLQNTCYLVSFGASPSGKMILNTKKKMIIETPPVMKVTSTL